MEMEEKIIAIIGITEAAKQYGIPSDFCPTLAIVVGALLTYAEKPDSRGILEGILLGATVTGGYALIKRVGRALLSPFTKKSGIETLEHDDYRGV